MNPRIEAILNHVHGPAVLDLGCVQHDASNADREDWLHKHLASQYDDVLGVDVLKADIQHLQDRGYHVQVADAETLSLSRSFDTVVAGELLEHVSNPGKLLDRAFEHLNYDGRLVLTTPNPWAIGHLLRWITSEATINSEHVAWYGPIVLRQLLDRHGFEIVELRAVNYASAKARWLRRLGFDELGASTWLAVAQAGSME